MVKLWWEGRRLQRQYAAFLKKWRRIVKEREDDPTFNILTDEDYGSELRRFQQEIRANKSERLLIKARRVGIDVHRELPEGARDSITRLLWWDENETDFFFFRT